MMEENAAAEDRNEPHLPPGPRATPWLVFRHGKGRKDQTFFNLCEPSNGKTCRKSIPELTHRLFRQSASNQGWLIILIKNVDPDPKLSKWKFGDCFLWNPASLETIQLPTMSHLVRKGAKFHVIDAVMSYPPSNTDGSSMVFFIFDGNGSSECVLVYCSPGVDKIWKMQELPMVEQGVRAAFCFKGKLYILCVQDLIIEIEILGLDDDDDNDDPISLRSFPTTHQPVSAMLGRFNPFRELFVDSCDEFFRVVQIYHPKQFEMELKEVFTIEIYRMDFTSMTWLKVKSLDNHVLFVGSDTTMSCSATEMGLTRGCVYFTLNEDMSLYKFDLEGDSISVSLPCPDLPTPWHSADWLMIPTAIRVADGRRIEDMSSTNEEEYIIKEAEENKPSIESIDVDVKEVSEQNSECALEKSGSWDMFNDSMEELVSSYLHPVDNIHSRAVSKANQSEIASVNWEAPSTDIIHTMSLSPWLVFSGNNDPIYNFTNPMQNNQNYLMNLSEFLVDAKIRFSKDGWLLMSSGKKKMFFFNPFTRERIQLPDLPGRYEYMFYGISFSSLPTSSDCVVFAITEWSVHAVFIFYISRGDTSWTYNIVTSTGLPSNGIVLRGSVLRGKFQEFVPWFNNPVFFNGGFYCVDYVGTLGVFDLEDNFSWKVFAKPDRPCSSVYQSFLVECDGKLLSVFLGHLGSRVWVFRLDLSKKVWVKVKSLGKHMLFISHTSCLSAIAPNSSMENKIYFPRFHAEGILFYSLSTGRYHSLGSSLSSQDFNNTKEQLNCSWIEANWSLATVQELDWFNV